MKFRKKPVVIEAMQFLDHSSYEIIAWAKASQPPSSIGRHTVTVIERHTTRGVQKCAC